MDLSWAVELVWAPADPPQIDDPVLQTQVYCIIKISPPIVIHAAAEGYRKWKCRYSCPHGSLGTTKCKNSAGEVFSMTNRNRVWGSKGKAEDANSSVHRSISDPIAVAE